MNTINIAKIDRSKFDPKLDYWQNCVNLFADYCRDLNDDYLGQTIRSHAVEWIDKSGANSARSLLGVKTREDTVLGFCSSVEQRIRRLDRRDYWRGVNRQEWREGSMVGFRSYNTVYSSDRYVPDGASESWQKGFISGWNRKLFASR